MSKKIPTATIRKQAATIIEKDLTKLIADYGKRWEEEEKKVRLKPDYSNHPEAPCWTEFRIFLTAQGALERAIHTLRVDTLEERVAMLETRLHPKREH